MKKMFPNNALALTCVLAPAFVWGLTLTQAAKADRSVDVDFFQTEYQEGTSAPIPLKLHIQRQHRSLELDKYQISGYSSLLRASLAGGKWS